MFLGLEYAMITNEGPVLFPVSYAFYGDNIPGGKSSEGWIFKLFSGVIDYASNKQKIVTKSSTEFELLALSHSCEWLLWWVWFFDNLELDIEQDLTV